METIIIFLFGLIIGSFLNVVIYRIPNEQSIVMSPSHCPSCKTRLKIIDLVPVVSWVLLRGQCRHCKASIKYRYSLIELLTGIVYVILYLNVGYYNNLIPFIVLSSILIADTFIDIDHFIIPDKLNIFALLSFFILNTVFQFIPWKDAFIGAFSGFIILFLLFILTSGNGIGFGDVKLISVIGLYLGFPFTLLSLLLSFILGGVFGVILLATKIKTRKDPIPFGPWIALAAFISMNFGLEILNWYFNLVLI